MSAVIAVGHGIILTGVVTPPPALPLCRSFHEPQNIGSAHELARGST
jgi:hypothetical protein